MNSWHHNINILGRLVYIISDITKNEQCIDDLKYPKTHTTEYVPFFTYRIHKLRYTTIVRGTDIHWRLLN